ncbi:hypothetical protein HUJ05_004756 [Dendroctonus ponderosae]|nr:hypothetical protein HUJ05_004756 [Dendroctonus ponderosae]
MRFGFFLGASLEKITRTLPLILLLRQPDFSVSCSNKQAYCDRDKGSEENCWKTHSQVAEYSTAGEMAAPKGLLLYYNEYSFYSQKVVLALHEKKLPFETHDIDLNGEQYKPWFLQINPRGEVPVLQDSGKIIPDSARIIDYLEDNFSNGHSPRLIPMDQGGEVRQKITYFRGIIDKINGNVLTIGSLLHPELATGSKKVPFIGPVRKQLVNADKDSAKNLRKYAEDNPGAREMLLEKAENQEKKHEKMLNKEEFVAILKEADKLFDEVEAQLAQHADKTNWWLCTDEFTVADVSLTILLVRVNQIGMEPYFWTNGKRPHVEQYFMRVQERDSYKKTIPTAFSLVKTVFKTQMPLIIGEGTRHQLQAKIKKCLAINIKADDFLPKVVCAKCLKQLELCNAFREECINSESMLSSYFKNYRHTDEFKKSGKVYIKDTAKSDSEPIQNTNKKPVAAACGPNHTRNNLTLPLYAKSIHSSEINMPSKPIAHSSLQVQHLPYSMDMLNEALKKAVQQLPKEILNKVVVNSNGEVINFAPLDAMTMEPTNISHNISSINNRVNDKFKKGADKQDSIIKIDLTLDEIGEDSKNKLNAMSYSKPPAHLPTQNPTMIFPAVQLQNNNFATVPTNTVYPPAISPSASTVINVICSNPTEITSTSPSSHSSINIEDLRSSQAFLPSKSRKSDTSKIERCNLQATKGHNCELCPKKFKRREHLYQHMKLHTGFRPYQCTDCKKTFVRKEHLLRHMVLHSGERNFSCDICTKSFSRHDNLLKHVRTHNKGQSQSETTYTCDVCQKVYLVKRFYDNHRAEIGRCFLAPHLRICDSSRSMAKNC